MKLCGAVRISVRYLHVYVEVDGDEVKRSESVGGVGAWKCVLKDRHRGQHRDQDGNEW